jgi:hypothetical protein
MTEVHVFGVMASTAAPPSGTRAIVHGELAAIVDDAAAGPVAATALLRAHSRILESTAATATVLPVRFGTAMRSDAAVVEEFLRPQHDALAARLARLDGKVQLSVKASYEEEALLRGVVAASPGIAKLRERVQALPEAAGYYQRIRLGELVSAEVDAARERDAGLVLARLRPLAVEATREPPSTPDCAVNAAFLVEREAIDAFSRAVAALGVEVAGRMHLRYIGPLPPYSFTGDETAEEVPAWA